MRFAFPGKNAVSGGLAVAVCVLLYLGAGAFAYAVSADAPMGFADPCLYAMLVAWPALLVLSLLKWILLASLACLAAIGLLVARDALRDRNDDRP